jgi:hypothetical protein
VKKRTKKKRRFRNEERGKKGKKEKKKLHAEIIPQTGSPALSVSVFHFPLWLSVTV